MKYWVKQLYAILSCDISVVLDTIRWYTVDSRNTTNNDTTCDFDHNNRFSRHLSNGHATNEISFQLTLCVVSSEANIETWWWPSARAETCSLSNKYYTTLL